MEDFSMHVLPSLKNYLKNRVIDTLRPSHGSAGPVKPDLSPHPEKELSGKHKRFRTNLPVLIFLLLTAVLPIPAVFAEGDPGIILGSGAITTENKVYFGNYSDNPVLWRVIGDGNAGSGMLLLSEYLLDSIQFNPYENNKWQECTAKDWCGAFFSGSFSESEQSAVLPATKTDDEFTGRKGFGTSELIDESVFFLSAEEAEQTYFSNDASRIAYFENGSEAARWWLRSRIKVGINIAGIVDIDGWVTNDDYVTDYYGARPAFNLDLSSVLFSSEISSNQYKLTLKDENLSISITENAVVTRNGSTVTIPYTNSSGTKACVMVTDKAYTENGASVLYYAALTTGGTGQQLGDKI